jgi:CRISPR-associated protein Cmr2
MSDNTLWQTKVAARLHDPAEKALVLLRDPEGHENGTSRALRRLLGFDAITTENVDPDNDGALTATLFKKGIPATMYRHVQRADWWAAGADRPQWPMREITVTTKKGEERTLKVADWAQVRWSNKPVLVHPLTGKDFPLGNLGDTEIQDIKQRSFDHVAGLLAQLNAQDTDSPDWRKILLALWRFGTELTEEADNGALGNLWPLLPADTRIPDHSIWDHLDLTSAFAGAFAADPQGEVALLTLSIGPVQDFIAAARSTSDLWAGSHLLSRLAWETMRPLCETFGPDAILFPRLRGIPQVDLWLRDKMDLPDALFDQCEWKKSATDANPLFSAALPNRFVAVVPASKAMEIAESCQSAVRQWLLDLACNGLAYKNGTIKGVVTRLLEEAGYDKNPAITSTPYEQMEKQLDGFPEVHWAIVPFSLIRPRDQAQQKDLDLSALKAAMSPFFGVAPDQESGFLKRPAWQVLRDGISWGDNTVFFDPKPGVLYPAIHELAERALAAAKSARTFSQRKQEGWRCSLTGEAQWLTTDPEQLKKSYRQQPDTLWAKIARKKPSWAKKGEHLSALPAIKRLWPTIFAEEVGKALNPHDDGRAIDVGRFVVSTHTMALAHQLDAWLEKGGLTATGLTERLNEPGIEPVALPRRLLRRHRLNPDALRDAKRLPGLLEKESESDDESARKKAEKIVRATLNVDSLETYYALIMMDGDHMGAILSGDEKNQISYLQSFHPQVRQGFQQHAETQPKIREYGTQKRPVSPNRHLAISGALNDFSQTVVRHVVESERLGRVLYAGGDDVLAMLPVADLLSAMQRLRQAYSGDCPKDDEIDRGHTAKENTLLCKNGFAWLNGRLMRMMGENATASCGAVVAHHQAPLSAVLRELRIAEKRAKQEGGRDAFSITIIKRSGGALYLTAKWGEPLRVLNDLIGFLREDDVSRRAVYHTLEWLTDLPAPADNPDLCEAMLAYQLARQARENSKGKAPDLARDLTKLAKDKSTIWLKNFLSIGEFLARETRASQESPQGQESPKGAYA